MSLNISGCSSTCGCIVCVYICKYADSQFPMSPAGPNPNYCIILSDNMLPVLSTQSHQTTLGNLIFYISISKLFLSHLLPSQRNSAVHISCLLASTQSCTDTNIWVMYFKKSSSKYCLFQFSSLPCSSRETLGNTDIPSFETII